MVLTVGLSPSDAAGSAQRVFVARVWTPSSIAARHCLEDFGFLHSNLELEEESVHSVVQS